MKTLEIINVRNANNNLLPVIDGIRKSIFAVETIDAFSVYRRDDMEAELTIYIEHMAANDSSKASGLGLRLVSCLQDFGPVNHTVWEKVA